VSPWIRGNPDWPWPAWKMHRFILRKVRCWWTMRCPGLPPRVGARYFSEGRYHYLFELRGRAQLLKIRRDQFYHPLEPVGESEMRGDVELMNELAGEKVAVPGRHLWGGCALTERADRLSTEAPLPDRALMAETFDRLARWSLRSGLVLTDLVEENFGLYRRRLVLLDVERRRCCRLADIGRDPCVRGCIAPIGPDEPPEEILHRFLDRERDALIARYAATDERNR